MSWYVSSPAPVLRSFRRFHDHLGALPLPRSRTIAQYAPQKRHPKETRAEYSIRVTAGPLRGLETRYAGPTFYYHFANVEMLREKGYKVVSEEDVDEFGMSSCPEYTRCSLNSRW